MTKKPTPQNWGGLSVKLSAPATRALEGAGYTKLEQLTQVTEAEIAKLHGIGPNAIKALNDALQQRGLTFKPSK